MAAPGRIPLRPFSELGLYIENDWYPKNDFTQMEFQGRVDAAALGEAFRDALRELPVFQSHLREVRRGRGYELGWEFDREKENSLIVRDCREVAPDPFEPMKFLSEYFREVMEQRIDLATEFPITAYLLRVGDDRHIFSIRYHHAAMDPASGYQLLTETLGGYHARIRGEEPAWSGRVGMGSLVHTPKGPRRWNEPGAVGRYALRNGERLLAGLARDGRPAELASREIWSYRKKRGRHSLRLRFDDAAVANGLAGRAARSKAILDDLLLAITHKTCLGWNRQHGARDDRFRTMLVINLKSRLEIRRKAGVGLSALSFESGGDDSPDLDDLIRHFRRQRFSMMKRSVDVLDYLAIDSAIRRTQIFPFTTRHKLWQIPAHAIPVTAYLSNLGVVWPRIEQGRPTMESEVLGAGDFEISDLHSSVSISRNIGLGVTARIHAGRLFINFVCDRFRFRRDEAERLVEIFEDELMAAL